MALTRLPSGETFWLVNVHFDWVDDDAFRFQQAERLAEHLCTLEAPYLLLGEFNDTAGSRTLALFESIATPAIWSVQSFYSEGQGKPAEDQQ